MAGPQVKCTYTEWLRISPHADIFVDKKTGKLQNRLPDFFRHFKFTRKNISSLFATINKTFISIIVTDIHLISNVLNRNFYLGHIVLT
jgi:hypothetical protein